MTFPTLPGAAHRAPVGSSFSLIPLDGFDKRRADTGCCYCAKPVSMRSAVVVTRSGRWAHVPCHEELGPVVDARS